MMQLQYRQKVSLIAISIIAVCIALWLFNPLSYYFLNDDLVHILLSKAGVLFQRKSFRPICDLSIRLDYLIWNKKAFGYHLTNLVLHVFNSFMVYLLTATLFRKYVSDKDVAIKSLLASVLFFVWAFHSETIFWILGRSASLGTFLFIPSLIFYLHRSKGLYYFLFSLLFFVAALFTYESSWIFPLVVVVLFFADKTILQVSPKKEFFHIAVVLILFTLYLAARYNVIGEVAGDYEASNFRSINPIALSLNFIRLFVRTFAPPLKSNFQFISAIILLALAAFVMLVSSWKKLIKDKSAFVVLIIFILSYTPYLSLGIDTHSVEGERFLYLPSTFAAILVVQMIFLFAKKFNNQLIIFSLLLIYQLLFLYYSHTYYSTASKISQLTFQQMNLLKGKRKLYIDSLPQTNNGALIFRLGFEQGVQWLKENGTVDSVIVLSIKKDNEYWDKNFDVEYNKADKLLILKSIMVKRAESQQGYIQNQIPATTFNPQTDALFIYNTNTLKVIK